MVERTRTTYAVSARWAKNLSAVEDGSQPESSRSGALEFEASISGDVVRFGLLDRAGAEGRLLLVVAARLTAQTGQVCAEATLKFRISVGLFFDVWVTRMAIPNARCDFRFGHAGTGLYNASITGPTGAADHICANAGCAAWFQLLGHTGGGGRQAGTWSILVGPCQRGLSLASSTGVISGSPKAAVGDYPIVIQFVDNARLIATTTIRIRVQPSSGIGGGDIQVNLRWVGAADLDLHVSDPSGEEIYYAHRIPASGRHARPRRKRGMQRSRRRRQRGRNVFWPPHAAPVGSYVAWVKVYATCSAPLDWHPDRPARRSRDH